MDYRQLLPAVLLCCTFITASYSHVIFEENQNMDNTLVNNNKMKLPDLPPISIVGFFNYILQSKKRMNKQHTALQQLTLNTKGIFYITDLTKTSLKLSRKEAEKKKAMKKKAERKKPPRSRPPPPPNCVATWSSCKLPSRPCCDFCAFCHCRLFQTVCYCRMGNPNC